MDPAAFGYFMTPEGHDHMLAALRQVLADGEPRTIEQLYKEALAQKLLPETTQIKYLRHAINAEFERRAVKNEKQEFVTLPDGRIRLNIPRDLLAGHQEVVPKNPELDAFIAHLRASCHRQTPDSKERFDLGAGFERDVARGFELLGFIAQREGGIGQPDVVVTAPLGRTTYTIAVECKTAQADREGVEETSAFAAEAARLRDKIGATYGLILGPPFAGNTQLDGELVKHAVALWDIDAFEALLRANDQHPIAWPDYINLLAPGRGNDGISAFALEHTHGARKRAHVVFRYMIEEGFAYQLSLSQADPEIQKPDAPLTPEVLATLVNQRLEREHDLARIGVEDIKTALQLATHPTIDAARIEKDGSVTIVCRLSAE